MIIRFSRRMTNHLEIKNVLSRSFQESPEFPRIFFSMQIEASGINWESLRNLWKFPELINIAYDIIIVT